MHFETPHNQHYDEDYGAEAPSLSPSKWDRDGAAARGPPRPCRGPSNFNILNMQADTSHMTTIHVK